MIKAGSDTLHLLLVEKKPKKVQQIHFRIALDDIYHECWVEGGVYLTEDNKLWVPSWGLIRERILPIQQQFHYDDSNKDEGKYSTKSEVASSLAKFIPFEAIPPWPNTSDEQESRERRDKFFFTSSSILDQFKQFLIEWARMISRRWENPGKYRYRTPLLSAHDTPRPTITPHPSRFISHTPVTGWKKNVMHKILVTRLSVNASKKCL